MDTSRRQDWTHAALLAGAIYFFVGRLFALPVSHVQAWRWAAWIVSGIVFGAHIWYEHFGLRNAPRLAALHVAGAAGLGAFGLAVAGMVHSLTSESAFRPVWLLALVLFPVVTAVPAFLVAFAAGKMLPRNEGSAE